MVRKIITAILIITMMLGIILGVCYAKKSSELLKNSIRQIEEAYINDDEPALNTLIVDFENEFSKHKNILLIFINDSVMSNIETSIVSVKSLAGQNDDKFLYELDKLLYHVNRIYDSEKISLKSWF